MSEASHARTSPARGRFSLRRSAPATTRSAGPTGARPVAVVAPAGGFVLGYDDAGAPVVVRLFRPAPTRLYAELPVWAVRLLVYRAAPLGAATAVVTDDRQYWQPLADTVSSAGGRIDLYRGQQPGRIGAGTPYRPSLVVDASPQWDGLRAELDAWQTVLSLQGRAIPRTVVRALRSCDGALLHRMDVASAEAVRQAYALDAGAVEVLTSMPDESVAIAVPRRLRVAALRPTAVERQSLRLPEAVQA